MNQTSPATLSRHAACDELPALDPAVIHRIRQALARVGDFGEIGLVIVKGEIKYLRITCSEGLSEGLGPGLSGGLNDKPGR